MQPVETLHDLQVGRRHRTWQVVIQSRLMRRTSACFVIGRSCSQSIIALRSTIRVYYPIPQPSPSAADLLGTRVPLSGRNSKRLVISAVVDHFRLEFAKRSKAAIGQRSTPTNTDL